MEIRNSDDGRRGIMGAEVDGRIAGSMTYTRAGEGKIIIDHTDVREDFKGQGVGRKLLEAMVAMARDNSLKIIPLCPYAKAQFDRDKSISDVLFSL